MTAWTSFVSTARSTPLTISVPSSSATCRFLSSSSAKLCNTSTSRGSRAGGPPSDTHGSGDRAARARLEGARESARDGEPELSPERAAARSIVEATVGARIAWQRLEQVVGRVDGLRLAGVLALPAVPEQDEIARARGELLAPEELLRAPAHRQLPDRLLHAEERSLGVRLRLVDRRYRLRLVADLLAVAVELRRVDRAGENDRDGHVPALLAELDACRLEERAEGRLRGAVGTLKRNPAVSERRVDGEERATRGTQVRQRRPVPVDLAEEVDVHDAAELLRRVAVGLGVDG